MNNTFDLIHPIISVLPKIEFPNLSYPLWQVRDEVVSTQVRYRIQARGIAPHHIILKRNCGSILRNRAMVACERSGTLEFKCVDPVEMIEYKLLKLHILTLSQ